MRGRGSNVVYESLCIPSAPQGKTEQGEQEEQGDEG